MFKGRTNRATYWLSAAIVAALLLAIALIAPSQVKISEVVLVILAVPRLHDIGRTGWWVMAGVALEVVGLIVALFVLNSLAATGLVSLGVLGLMAWLGAIPGEDGPNRFGPKPGPGLSFGRSNAR
jgi:uncharacterized membrane protein YhaH (DUF805 family)